ncbi:Hypothetical_protein [Hexamita inflata]|uniref:Hypothetical_protein n=1 Tax=Hexamita inflata TaxID=28002 RepID=A0AA86PXQ8_9EUKA|nr:Hypothetical protein HINF_LOCUS29874 [Hexamita inflata]
MKKSELRFQYRFMNPQETEFMLDMNKTQVVRNIDDTLNKFLADQSSSFIQQKQSRLRDSMSSSRVHIPQQKEMLVSTSVNTYREEKQSQSPHLSPRHYNQVYPKETNLEILKVHRKNQQHHRKYQIKYKTIRLPNNSLVE